MTRRVLLLIPTTSYKARDFLAAAERMQVQVVVGTNRRQALIPVLVGRENISSAIAFNSMTFQVGTFLGPLLAGIFIATWGAGASILISSVA